jgi:hypothetical protein
LTAARIYPLHLIYGQFTNSAISFNYVTTAPAAIFSSTEEEIYKSAYRFSAPLEEEDVKIILKRILKKYDGRVWTGFMWLRDH